jgi:CRISPR-associated protein Cas2
MSVKTYHVVVSYDVHDPKRLQRVGKSMKDYGERVLKSVFECNLTERQFQRMVARLEDIIDHVEDSIRYYFVCEKCVNNVEYSGLGQAFAKDETIVIM